jgi:hypothetical protein
MDNIGNIMQQILAFLKRYIFLKFKFDEKRTLLKQIVINEKQSSSCSL